MRKLYLLATIVLGGLGALAAQSQQARIDCYDPAPLCAGFQSHNEATIVLRQAPPVAPSENSTIEYLWTAVHANGSWTWRTNYNTRRVLMPWAGDYVIKVQIMYYRPNSRQPYYTATSNEMKLTATVCDEDQ